MNGSISVVWGIDKKYILQAFVVMHSILANSNEKYNFYILSADEIEIEIIKFSKLLKARFKNVEIEGIRVNAKIFNDVEIFSRHLSLAAYNRLLIADLLPFCDKCIYLDCDVLVQGNLKELYNFDVEEYYIAGVKDCHVIADNEYENEHERVMGIPNRDTYINSGVMVMNLKKIREDNLTPIFLDSCGKENWNEDQDVLNVCCYGKIKVLPLKYNLFHFYKGNRMRLLYDLPYEKTDFDFSWDKPFILHMGGVWKPWISERYTGAHEWWAYAELYQDTEEYRCYKDNCSKRKDYIKGLSVASEWCKSKKSTVIWGFTDNGRCVYNSLRKKGVNNIEAFVDNNEENYCKNYEGISVIAMQTVLNQYEDVAWIISCKKAYKEVLQQLEYADVKTENVIWWYEYIHNSKMYYRALSEEYYEKELEDIAIIEGMSMEVLKKGLAIGMEWNPDLAQRYYLNQWILLTEE